MTHRSRVLLKAYRGTSLIRKRNPLGPYSTPVPRALWCSQGGGAVSYERGTPVGTERAHIREPLSHKFGTYDSHGQVLALAFR